MKSLLITFLFLVIVQARTFAQGDSTISRINTSYNEWQSWLAKGSIARQVYYHSVWGENYERERWSSAQPGDTATLAEVAQVFNGANLGHLVVVNTNSISGDWVINAENYYDKNGNLYYIFWTMNTFQADVPATIEKRLYFDSNQSLITEDQQVYKLNTRKKADIGFADHDVTITIALEDFAFLKLR